MEIDSVNIDQTNQSTLGSNDDKKDSDALNNQKRNQWSLGSKVEIFSNYSSKWESGTIINIFYDDEGEWLLVQYVFRSKEIQRFSKLIRPINDDTETRLG